MGGSGVAVAATVVESGAAVAGEECRWAAEDTLGDRPALGPGSAPFEDEGKPVDAAIAVCCRGWMMMLVVHTGADESAKGRDCE